MNEWWVLYPGLFIWGLFLGFVYFAGLWLSVSRMNSVKHPSLLMTLSFLSRNIVIIAGFYWGMAGELPRLITILAGVMLMRFIFIGRIKKVNGHEKGLNIN